MKQTDYVLLCGFVGTVLALVAIMNAENGKLRREMGRMRVEFGTEIDRVTLLFNAETAKISAKTNRASEELILWQHQQRCRDCQNLAPKK